MLRSKQDEIEWLSYELLANIKGFDHRVFLRKGGCSTGAYSSLNFGRSMGDSPENVTANYKKVEEIMTCAPIVDAHQCHGKDLVYVDHQNKMDRFVCDILSTNERELPLLVKHADCQAACFYDPIHHAVSLVHCGWRGNVQNIYAETISAMRQRYGSEPSDLLVCISPSLGPERSEFIHYKTEFPESFWQFQYKPLYFDLWALSEWQLQKAGILPHHIQIARESTWTNSEDYFSYRRSKQTGCHGAIAILR